MKNLKNRSETLDWIGELSEEAASRVLTALNGQLTAEYSGMPREIIVAIHNLALFKAFRTVNASRTTLLEMANPMEGLTSYDLSVDSAGNPGRTATSMENPTAKSAKKKWTRRTVVPGKAESSEAVETPAVRSDNSAVFPSFENERT